MWLGFASQGGSLALAVWLGFASQGGSLALARGGMEEFLPFAGMIFSLLVVLIIAGSILLFPLTRRLGTLLEMRIQDRRDGEGEGALSSGEVSELRELMLSLQAEVERVAERQQFTERLLEGAAGRKEPGAAGRGGDPTT